METPESHILLLHLPGYAQEDIGAQFEYDYRRVRVFGGRALGDNRSIRFNILYAVPSNCDVNKLKGTFQGEIYSVIMPKVTTSKEIHDQNSPKSSPQAPQKSQMEICEEPKSTIESEKEANETSTAPKATNDIVPQKGEGVSQDAKNQAKEKCASGKPPPKGNKEHVMDETSFITKCEENGKDKGKEKVEMNIGSSKRKGIKEVAASTSHVVAKLVKGFNEEDMIVLYTSATVLVLALGVYASYKFRSFS
uniref:SHSP domain-containing protein n=2 Tax=Cajanus cajan TaxID=3821 RepID=A0A151SFD1_CAJCA|nr:hypothetical protein KK1_024437 [Cajanus cajan]